MSLLHFRKQLALPPVAADAAGIRVRKLAVPNDIRSWLALRERAMAGETPAARTWTENDFLREFVGKTWWRDDHTWCVAADQTDGHASELAGAVILGLREGTGYTIPAVHWLLVDPAFRRRGIGRALMSRLERAAFDAGGCEVQLETHAGWAGAVAFYQSMGYAPVRERSPR